jgi:hypothetical protein
VEDNLEVYLEGTRIEIEADDNLHAIISADFRDNVLYILKRSNKIQEIDCKGDLYKRFKSVSSKNETVVNAIQQVQLDSILLEVMITLSYF